jgi:F0F1-type ATP synthase assembly protein I
MTSPFLRFALTLVVGTVVGAAMGYFGQCTSGTCPLTSTWWRGALYGGFLGLIVALSRDPA